MESNCGVPCEDVKKLRQDFDSYRQRTTERLEEGRTRFAVIDIKLNWLIAILGSIGAALLGVLLKTMI